MVRSIFLRGFDQQCADIVGNHLEKEGVKMQRPCTMKSIEKVNEEANDGRGQYLVTGDNGWSDTFDTVVYAIGREADLEPLNLKTVGVETEKSKIVVDDFDRTTAENIFCIGDVAKNRPELTPAAIQGGEALMMRLYGDKTEPTDYETIPTTIFTPIEYSCCGLKMFSKKFQVSLEVFIDFVKFCHAKRKL